MNRIIWGGNVSPFVARLKKEVIPIHNALAKVNSLRGVNFKWKDGEGSHKHQMDVFAQDVEDVFPEVTSTDDAGK